ncbi:MAG: ExbD/TolR family protein [Phycisphaerae bacterium]
MLIQDRETEGEESINLMPLIDMVFLLLIFFLVATTFAQQERDLAVQLPGTSAPEPLSAPPKQLIVNIHPDGSLVINGTSKTFEQLSDLLTTVAQEDTERQVLVRADGESKHKYFAEVVALCRERGINPVNVGYLFQESARAGVE